MTFAEYAAIWRRGHATRLAPNARRAYDSALEHHVLPAFGGDELACIAPGEIRQWLRRQLASGRAPNSVKAHHRALSTILTDAVLDGHLVTNVAIGAGRRIWPRGLTGAPRALTPTELERFLLAAKDDPAPWARDFFLLAARTGLRLGELLALQAHHVTSDGLRIEQSYFGAGRVGPVKNKRSRLVELSPQARTCCERLVDQAVPLERWLFLGRHGRLPIHPSSAECAFDRILVAAGLPAHHTIHSLRHSLASILAANGAPATWLQLQLGHSSYRVSMDLYGSWLTQRRPDLMAMLDGDPARHPPLRHARPAHVIDLASRRR